MSFSESANTHPHETKPQISPTKIVAACSIGNLLEWYDIVLYNYLAVYISKTFFPSENEVVSLLMTFGTFALSYLARPIGALVLGAYTDSKGRKPALVLTLYLMTIGTVVFALIPSYSAIGIAAPILVLGSRLLQGFSAGGEFGSATTMMIEQLPRRKGLVASFQFSSQGVSTILAAGVGLLLSTTLSDTQISSWGFRIAYLGGGLIGIVAAYIRRYLPESPEYTSRLAMLSDADTDTESDFRRRSIWLPARDLLRWNFPIVLLLICLMGLGTAGVYTIQYIPTYSIKTLGLPGSVAFSAVLVGGVIQTVLNPLGGYLSDKIGKVRNMLVFGAVLGLIVYPLFGILSAVATVVALFITLTIFVAVHSIFTGPSGAVQGLLFPAEARGIGLSFTYNTGVAIFGGITPFMNTLLIDKTGQDLAPAYWLAFMAAVAVVCLIIIQWKYRIDGLANAKK